MIDPRASIDPSARIGGGVTVGPYSVIGADVTIGDGTTIGPHVVINGPARIGCDNRIFQFSSLGEEPQDTSYAGEPTELVIGDRNVIREFVTVSRGTVRGLGRTTIGNDNLIMAYVHIAHDCVIGSNAMFSNAASLAGHVVVEDHAILGGFTLVHQFCRIGAYAFTGMGTALNLDLPPYTLATGNYARAVDINKRGLKRHGFTPETVRALHQAFRIVLRRGSREAAWAAVEPLAAEHPEVVRFLAFVRESKRGVVRIGRGQ